jgi:REP element-mobilizing transposase RayT
MPRLPRYRHAQGALEPGSLYHVTNRGVDRCNIFHSDLDRVLFLAFLADACLQTGVICHAYCLMRNHIHLIIEDSRGQLSQFLHRLESPYARYFNDTRPRRRCGPLFQGRFHADLIDSRAYFEDACAYVLHNPLRTAPPIVERPEWYPWSSAAFVLGPPDLTAAAFSSAIVDRIGGLEKVLASLPPPSRKSSAELRRRRFAALVSGHWLEREQLLAERSPEQYAAELAARRGAVSPFPPRGRSVAAQHVEPRDAMVERRSVAWCLPARAIAFSGVLLEEAKELIDAACTRFAPTRAAEAAFYMAYRFTSASIEMLARTIQRTPDEITRAIEYFRQERLMESAWTTVLWQVEWALRWSLRAAPWRC